MKKGKGFRALLILVIVLTIVPDFVANAQAALPDGSTFSIVQISDTQHLAFLNASLYNETISWIVSNAANYNVKMVVHTGDFVDAFYGPPITMYNATQSSQQWAIVSAALSKLLDANIPYCWNAGNHDQSPFGKPNGTMLGTNYAALNASSMESKSYWVGDIFDSKNTAAKFTVNNYPFMIISLENLANSSAIAWMKNLLDENPGVNVIVTTHDYLDANGAYDTATAAIGNWTSNLKATLDGYSNVFLALCGHNNGWNATQSGSREEILFDRQESNNMTGAASVRIYTFDLANKKVDATTYSVDTNTWLTDVYNQFSFSINLQQTPTTAPTPTAFYGAAVVAAVMIVVVSLLYRKAHKLGKNFLSAELKTNIKNPSAKASCGNS
ncbi:MAG: metallophosphoesterase [Chloroflexi bacterium]|nr:metallophosphoesterase [Chloroflexota bacterium]